MKTLHELLTGTLLVALTVFGLTALTSSSTNSSDTRVLGFLNETCDSEDLILFQNMIDLLDFNGTEMAGVTWTFESYINVSDYEVTDNPTCNSMAEFLAMPEVSTTRPKPKIIPADPPGGGSGGGGGGGGGGGQAPAPTTPNPADSITDDEINKLKSCWEGKAGNKLKRNGWDINATTAATWKIDRRVLGALAQTIPRIKIVRGEKKLDLKVELYPRGLGARAIGHINWLWENKNEDPPPEYYPLAFRHLTTYSQMHETYHIGQLLKIFNERKTLPEPWEWWDLEVEAHAKSASLWSSLYDDPSPSFLKIDNLNNTDRATKYEAKKTEYLNLEKELADPKTTDERKAEIESELETLTDELKDPNNLPEAESNHVYSPGDVENFECEEEEEDE